MKLTYRKAWEIYIEPTLKEQEEYQKDTPATVSRPQSIAPSAPETKEENKAAAIAAGMMMGIDPLEVAKAFEKSWKKPKAKGGK